MRQSIYLILATTLIKADIYNEQRKKRKQQRPQLLNDLFLSEHLMRDIGLQPDGSVINDTIPAAAKAKKTVCHLRRLHYSKITT